MRATHPIGSGRALFALPSDQFINASKPLQALFSNNSIEDEMTINVENILKVADAIEARAFADALGFNMGTFKDPANDELADTGEQHCGSVACIAGWAEAVRTNSTSFVNDGFVGERSAEWLGLDDDQTSDLFYGVVTWDDFIKTTPQQAVAVLRHLAATGVVDWSVALGPKP